MLTQARCKSKNYVKLVKTFLSGIKENIPIQSTNRTVFTFVGDPASIVEAALAAAKVIVNIC